MNRSTLQKIAACILIWAIFVNTYPLNAQQVLSGESDTKNAPEAAADTIPDDGSTVDSLIDPLTVNRAECVDSVLVQLIKISKKSTFRIVTKQGKRYVGKIELIESGIELIGKEYKRGRYGNAQKLSIPWTDIEELKIKPKESHKDILIYIIGIPISFVISMIVTTSF